MSGKEEAGFSQFLLVGCKILLVKRQRRKLRIGSLKGNDFELTIRQISDQSCGNTFATN